jgi:hypothetical protein
MDEISRSLVKTVIALPLLDELAREEDERRQAGDRGTPPPPWRIHAVIIDLHRDFPGGRGPAREWVKRAINELIDDPAGEAPRRGEESIEEKKSDYTRQYLFARLSGPTIRELVLADGRPKILADLPGHHGEGPTTVTERAIFQIWLDFPVQPLVHATVSTLKADAARTSFRAEGHDIVWAVIDSGIQADHPHFQAHANLQGPVAAWHLDLTGEEAPCRDGYGHGTHVAGIIAGEIPDAGVPVHPGIHAYTRSLKADGDHSSREITCERLPLASISGIAPKTRLVSLKVLDEKGRGSVSNIIAALSHVQAINANGRHLHIHGVNLSVGYAFDAEWFACGQSQLCVEVERLVRSGVAVVVAAGNTGYGTVSTQFNAVRHAGLDLSINDPGNAEAAITVGSTHRTRPHVYGVSYFSSKGPTGDGRLKPDLVAPGEKVISCGVGAMAAAIAAKVPDQPPPNYVEDSGTSMAAPHVSGAAAAFLSVKQEFIGRPERLKTILMDTATDLRRDRQFQGAGLVDLMRAIQSV